MTARIRLLCLVLMLLTGAPLTQAQADTHPLIVNINGDYWAYPEGSPNPPTRLTTWEYQQDFNVSPDGTRIAFNSYATMTVDAIKRTGGFGGGALPSNIWMLDIAADDYTRLIDQPQGASLAVEGVPDFGAARSTPVWSPDGSQIAFTEMLYPAITNQLTLVDVAAGTPRTIVTNLPQQAGVPVPMEVMWGAAGLYLRSVSMDMNTTRMEDTFLIYDPAGTLLTTLPIPTDETRWMMNYLLATYDGQEYLAVQYNTGEWVLFDPRTGASFPAPALPEAYSPLAPQTSVGIRLVLDDDGTNDLQIIDAQGNAMGTPIDQQFYPTRWLAIAPDGQAVAYQAFAPGVSDLPLQIWRAGQVSDMPLPTDLPYVNISAFAWGPVAWRIGAAGVTVNTAPSQPQQSVSDACANYLTPRLTVGGKAIVLPGDPNNLRNSPSTGGSLIGQIDPGGQIDVMAGPTCAEGIVWWQVNFGGVVGWTAESQGKVYFLAPM